MGIKRVKNDKADALRIGQYMLTFHENGRLFTARDLRRDQINRSIERRNHLVRSCAR